MYLQVKENKSEKVRVADVEHQHHPDVNPPKVPYEIMEKIKEYENLGIKPREINKNLAGNESCL